MQNRLDDDLNAFQMLMRKSSRLFPLLISDSALLACTRFRDEPKILNEFAIGGAVAAILHNEPISTIDLDIFSAILGLEKNKKRCNLLGCLEL